MGKKNELVFLRILFVVSIGVLIQLMKKPPIKDWLIAFLLKSYIASLLDNIFVKKGFIKYPVRTFKLFDISVLFSYLIFPVTCVFFNQVTRNSSLLGIVTKCLLFSIPSTIVEFFIEKHTKLVQYKKGWNSFYSFVSITFTFLFVRFCMMVIQKSQKSQNVVIDPHLITRTE
ncbi:CBO0543 family protein [Niallia taxi]|uniref:CBO0543 family protein n=1 Tax=Niallia taxi TaxID=2499688 RepID=UPI003F5DE0BF